MSITINIDYVPGVLRSGRSLLQIVSFGYAQKRPDPFQRLDHQLAYFTGKSIRRRDNQKRKPVQSTFFPDTASHANVIDAITVVYGYGLSTVAHVDASVNGMRLQKKGATVFPAGGSDTRFAE